MSSLVAATKESSFVVGAVEVVGVVVEKDVGHAVFHEGVDDAFFGIGQGVEAGEDDLPVAHFFEQILGVQLRQVPGDHAVIAFALLAEPIAEA